MIKKQINQNHNYDLEILNSIDYNFEFGNKPINRLKNKNIGSKLLINEKLENLKKLKNEINTIEDCKLKENSNLLVFGSGDINSPVMLIGEAPGIEDNASTKTFKGKVGELLDKMLLAINIKKDNIYTTYVVNFNPPDDRKPASNEIKRYSTFLKRHIEIIDPKLIILMGSTAMEAIIGSNNKISSERGKWKEIIIKNKTYDIMITFNPSYLLRLPENKKYSWEDLKKIKKKINNLNLTI
jgi:uracil-DNA glycosylase